MYVLGLTGSIAMGKSWGASCFRELGIPVHDSDTCVHGLLAAGGQAVADVLHVFPGVEDGQGGVDRGQLSACVMGHFAELAVLEHILHPLVQETQRIFLAHHARQHRALVVLDIPLLFEVAAQNRVDGVVVMSAPTDLQYSRALARSNMTLEKLHAIMNHQLSNSIKCLGADFVVQTGMTKGHSLLQIKHIVRRLKHKPGQVWKPGWARS